MTKEENIYSTIELDHVSSTILNALNAQIAIINSNGEIVAYNWKWKNFSDELQEKEQWSHPHLEANLLQGLQAPLAEGNDFALHLLLGLKDVLTREKNTFETIFPIFIQGQKNWYRATINSLGEEDGAVLIYEDVSSQTQSREFLRETKQKLNKHFENGLYGILVANKDRTVIEANKKACDMLETTPQDIISSPVNNFLKIDLDTEGIQKRINREGNFIGEHEITTANGTQIPVELSVTLFRNEDGKSVTNWAFKDISEKKKAEQAFKVSELLYKLQFNNTLEGGIIGRPNGLMLEVNPAACDILGYKAEELKGKHRDIIFDINNPVNAAALADRRKNGKFRGEIELTHKKGHKIPVEVSSAIYEGEDGTEKTIINIKDISSRKAIEQQLISEKEFTDSAISSLPTIFFVIDEQGKFIRWNNILEKDLSYSFEEISEFTAFDVVHPEDHKPLLAGIKKALKGNLIQVEFRCISKNDELIHYNATGQMFIQNGEKYIVGGAINVSDTKKIEIEKEKNSELLNQLFHNSPIGIVLLNTEGLVQDSNKSFENIFGYSHQEIKGQNLDKTICPEFMNENAKTLSRLSFTGDSFQTETIRTTEDGKEIPVLIGGVPVEVDGKIIAIYGMYVDISERKALENQIVELLKTEQQARLHMQDMFEEAPSAIAMVEGEDHRYTFANDTYKKLVRKDNLLDQSIGQLLPEMKEQGFVDLLDTCYTEGKAFQFKEKKVYFNNGNKNNPNIHFLNFVFKPLRDNNDDVYGIFIEAVDVTEQVEARNVIQKSLAEKETLLNEIHHRVKNNLAVVSGLLELEIMSTEDENVSKRLYSTQSRISTIAKIHELLYQNESLSHVSFNEYAESMMMKSGKLMYNKAQQLVANFELEEVILNVNQAIPAGMLLNEIIDYLDDTNNSIFEGEAGGMILSMKSTENCVTIKLKDPANKLLHYFEDNENPQTELRRELIEVLLKQIHGNMELSEDKIHTLTISFSKREVKGPHSALKN